MVLYIRDIYDEKFVKEYIPKIILSRIRGLRVKKDVSKINEFLMKTYNIDIDDVIDAIEFSINKNNHIYSVSIDNNTIEENSQEKVISLVKLIDYGNLHIKGLDLINSSFNYIRNYFKAIYRSYEMFKRSL